MEMNYHWLRELNLVIFKWQYEEFVIFGTFFLLVTLIVHNSNDSCLNEKKKFYFGIFIFILILGLCEIALMNLSKDDPLYNKISKIRDLIDSMGEITKKLRRITSYKVKDYVGIGKIIDIEKSSNDHTPI